VGHVPGPFPQLHFFRMTGLSLLPARSWPFAAPAIAGVESPVLVIGNFDGVHRGHAAVVAEARHLANELARPLVAMTFEPHPRDVFAPSQPVFRLTSPAQKAALLKAAGADAVLALAFTPALAGLSAEAFVTDLLLAACGASGVVVGHDFHFGKGRAGTPELLASWLAERDIPCRIVAPQELGGRLLSSRAIRADLEAGDIAAATAALGRPWSVEAVVEHGDKRGRELGFPTANLHLEETCRLRHGIYAVRATVDGVTHDAIASFGRRPTFDDGRPKLEVMLFGFSGDLYGKTLHVAFAGWIRGEERFASVEALVAQMHADCAEARRLLSTASL
jgi:riboflavin kinase / FMN adenylyltransferase